MTVTERLADILKSGGKTRGYKAPLYYRDGRFDKYAVHHVEVPTADILLACSMVSEHDEVTQALKDGCSHPGAGDKVTIYADSLYHLLDKCAAPPPAPTPAS